MTANTLTALPGAGAFVVDDLGLAQFLIFRHHHARPHMDPTTARARFAFADTDVLRSDVSAYFTGAMVPALAYADAARIVKRLIRTVDTSRRGRESTKMADVQHGAVPVDVETAQQ
jgi:hypothetical protein